mgnify:CR=1 FL=1
MKKRRRYDIGKRSIWPKMIGISIGTDKAHPETDRHRHSRYGVLCQNHCRSCQTLCYQQKQSAFGILTGHTASEQDNQCAESDPRNIFIKLLPCVKGDRFLGGFESSSQSLYNLWCEFCQKCTGQPENRKDSKQDKKAIVFKIFYKLLFYKRNILSFIHLQKQAFKGRFHECQP